MTNYDDYDAGLLNDCGGGNIDWWHTYLRSAIEEANENGRQQYEWLLEEHKELRGAFQSVFETLQALVNHTPNLVIDEHLKNTLTNPILCKATRRLMRIIQAAKDVVEVNGDMICDGSESMRNLYDALYQE